MDKLLIVDDEQAMRRLLRINLADCYEIIDTGIPEQALAMALQDKPSAILLDLRMPNFSGYELCRTFKSMTFTQLIPIIIISGEVGATTKVLCKELGAMAFFEKPVDFEALRASLKKVLQVAPPDRRCEVRVHLRVKLKLQGTDNLEKRFEEISFTENVAKNGFLCGCTARLKPDAMIDVYLLSGGTKLVGKARVVRSEASDTPYPRYALRFEEKEGEWILQ